MNKKWIIKRLKNVKVSNPIMIEGLPGMGNVGKITVDFIIERLNATKIYEISSHAFPNCVFVNEKGITELPKVEIYHKKISGRDLFLVSGDMQPIDEISCYEFCDNLLDLFQSFKGKEVITLGGIGLNEPPRAPRIYCAGTDKATVSGYLNNKIKSAEGVVGPIIGVSGLLVGLSKNRGISGVVLLIETVGLPSYLGIKESKELLNVLNTKLKLGLNIKELSKEVKILEKEVNERVANLMDREEKKMTKVKKDVTNYIG